MNKIKTVLFMISLFLLLFGCGKKAVEISFTEQTVRAFGYCETAEYPLSTICTSRAELNTYIKSFNYNYSEDSAGQIMLADATAKYDEEFFKSKALILVLLSEPSGSVTHSVNMLFKSGNMITVELSRHVPPVATADMALWHLIFEVDQNIVKSGDEVKVSITE